MTLHYIKIEMILFCGHILLYCLVAAAPNSEDSLLSPQLEIWKIVPDTFSVYNKNNVKAMNNEIDHRTYHKFDSQQWIPSLKLNQSSLTTPEISALVIIVLIIIFASIISLVLTYCFYRGIVGTFCGRRQRGALKYDSILSPDVVDDKVVNV
ncbi:unnamed protein product [Orchesella dallaii]|uniref:Uncharacterized protein n=1 Tax=Orchesella dallaii TaxID=48710 RepID=A0ABP1QPX0_9HEXA